VARMRERAQSDFLTVTELADTLVRREDISFREAHRPCFGRRRQGFAGKLFRIGDADSVKALAPLCWGRDLHTSREVLLQSLDPVNFVEYSSYSGGPAPEAVDDALTQAEAHVAQTGAWVQEKSAARRRIRRGSGTPAVVAGGGMKHFVSNASSSTPRYSI